MNLVFATVLASRYAQVHTDLEQAHSDLLVLDKMKDDFLATTSHELRTPLHGIIGLTEALADGSLGRVSDRQAESIALINHSAAHLNGMVNEILDFSKITAGRADLFIHEINLEDVIKTVVSLVKASARDREITFAADIAPLPKIQADPDRLRQVLINLIGNAVKFTEKGTVTVRARPGDAGGVVISVTDTGVGIAPADMGRIFNPFEQAADPDTRKAGGTGLGLAIAKRLVELHGGTISAESRPGEGSTFTVTLPAVPPSKGIRRDRTDAGVLSPNIRRRMMTPDAVPDIVDLDIPVSATAVILAVDDDPVNLEVLSTVCGRAGYTFITAADGPGALKILEEKEIDLVLLDLMLPGMSGFEVCQTIRGMKIGRYVPVIMVTARDQVSDLVRSFKTGANDYITKPFNRNELLMRIESQLAIRYMLDMERSLLNGIRKEKDALTDLFHRSATLKESARQMSEWERIIKEDLDIAHQFQLKLMTHRKNIPWLDTAVRYQPLLKIGGDIYDVFEHRPGVTRMFLGDATGHGINASLNTVKILSEYAAVKESLGGPGEVVNYLNQRFVQYFKDYQIVFSCVAADIDRHNGTVRMAMAGHPEQYIISGGGIVPIKLRGPIVGLSTAVQYEESSFSLSPGEALVLFTDGMFEFFPYKAPVWLNQELSTTGIFDGIVTRGAATMPAEEMADLIMKFGTAAGHSEPIDDDITLFILKRSS